MGEGFFRLLSILKGFLEVNYRRDEMNNILDLGLKSDKGKIAIQVPTERIVEIKVKAPFKVSENHRTALNLALVIDRSGSMLGSKLEYVKQAALHVTELLGEDDRMSLVSFDDDVVIHASSVLVDSRSRQELKSTISQLHTGGSTNLSGGWLTGCRAIASGQFENGLNRALLLTDGCANVGIVDPKELGNHAGELNDRGISTTTLGVGLDFDHFLLEKMSEMGGGNYYFIEDPQSIPAIFQKELKELIQVSARAVEILVQIPENVSVQVLGGWRTKNDNNGLHIMLGDLVSDQQKEVFLKLLTPPRGMQETLEISANVFARDVNDGVLEQKTAIGLQYADKAEVDTAVVDEELMSRYAIVDSAEAANEALKLEQDGHYSQASVMLHSRTQANAPYMHPDEIKKYEGLSQRMKEGLDESDRKRSNYDANLRRKIREH
jgi:Ca-activated chloride channel homolog